MQQPLCTAQLENNARADLNCSKLWNVDHRFKCLSRQAAVALITLLAACASAVSYAQTPVPQWTSFVYGVANTNAQSAALTVDAAGSVYVTGRSSNALNDDYLTQKYDGSGNLLWVAIMDGANSAIDAPQAVAVNANGEVFVTGQSTTNGIVQSLTVKYDAAGNQVWRSSAFNGSAAATCLLSFLAADASGGVVAAGVDTSTGTRHFCAVRYDAFGAQAWMSVVSGAGSTFDDLFAMKRDGAGNIYLGGFSRTVATSDCDYFLVKLSSGGAEQWRVITSGIATGLNNDKIRGMTLDAAGNVYVTGVTKTAGTSYLQMTIKYDSNGNELWRTGAAGGALNTQPNLNSEVSVDGSGNVISSGIQVDVDGSSLLSVKYDASGMEIWRRRFFEGNGSFNSPIVQRVDSGGFVYVAGSVITAGVWTYSLVKYAPDGTTLWSRSYPAAGIAFGFQLSLEVDASGNALLFTSAANGAQQDWFLVSLDVNGNQNWLTNEGVRSNLPSTGVFAIDSGGNSRSAVLIRGSNSTEYAVTAFDAAGNQQWRVGSSLGTPTPVGAVIDAGGNAVVVGNLNNFFFVAKYAATGGVMWEKALPWAALSSNEIPAALAVDGDNNIFVTGQYDPITSSELGYQTVKLAPDGTELWRRQTLAGQAFLVGATSLAVGADGSVTVTGRMQELPVPPCSGICATAFDLLTIRYSSTGTELWRAVLKNVAGSNEAVDRVAVDASHNAYIAGGSATNGVVSPMLVKYRADGQEAWRVFLNEFAGNAIGMPPCKGPSLDAVGNIWMACAVQDATSGFGVATLKFNGSGVEQWRRFEPGFAPRWLTVGAGGDAVMTAQGLMIGYDAAGNEKWRYLTTPAAGYRTYQNYLDSGGSLISSGFSNGSLAEVFSLTKFALPQSPLAMLAVVSRKTHGSAGEFDLPVATNVAGNSVTVEPRVGNSGHSLVFQFNQAVTSAGAVSVVDSLGTPLSGITTSQAGNELRVSLSGISDRSRVTVSVPGVNGALAVSAVVGYLVGNVTGSRTVGSIDVGRIKSNAGRLVDGSSFRYDINASGRVGASDVVATKARQGNALQ